jgi:hypothetical protein
MLWHAGRRRNGTRVLDWLRQMVRLPEGLSA